MAKKINLIDYSKRSQDPPKITRYKDPVTGKTMSDFEGAIGSAPADSKVSGKNKPGDVQG